MEPNSKEETQVLGDLSTLTVLENLVKGFKTQDSNSVRNKAAIEEERALDPVGAGEGWRECSGSSYGSMVNQVGRFFTNLDIVPDCIRLYCIVVT